MARLAFCGLGRMGAPMAARLLEAEHDLVVWNRTHERADPLVERGARRASSPAEAARGAEAVITMLATPDAVRQVLSDAGAGLAPGATIIEMSTIGPDAVREVRDRLPEGAEMLDAPVLGSVPQATDGTLAIFVGGPDDAYRRWTPVLEELGRPRHVGPSGSGAAMKLVANSTLGAIQAALGEALALADALGLDQSAVLDVLSESPIGATVKSKRERIESGEYPPNFALTLALKDLRLVTRTAHRLGVEVPLAEAASAHFESAETAGLGDLDYSAVVADIRKAQ
jgi:3-hydroxyisobutyrate dehydrogenase-like beta-hydroxyacid dehydrogenase